MSFRKQFYHSKLNRRRIAHRESFTLLQLAFIFLNSTYEYKNLKKWKLNAPQK